MRREAATASVWFPCSTRLNLRTGRDAKAMRAIERREPAALKSFLAGGAGGVCNVLTGHPLDTIKVHR